MSAYAHYAASQDAAYKAAWAAWRQQDPETCKRATVVTGGPKTHPSSNTLLFDDEPAETVVIVEPEEVLEPEEILLEAIAPYLAGYCRPALLTAIDSALTEIKKIWNNASSSRAADAILEVLYLLGSCRDASMRYKAQVLQAVIARNEESLSTIASAHRLTRADASKVARRFKALLGIKISTSTRTEKVAAKCFDRASRVHSITRDDRERAEAIRRVIKLKTK